MASGEHLFVFCISCEDTLQNMAGVQPVHNTGSDKATGLQEALVSCPCNSSVSFTANWGKDCHSYSGDYSVYLRGFGYFLLNRSDIILNTGRNLLKQ